MQQLLRRDIVWCANRMPRKIFYLLRDNGPKVCVAGGFIRSCIANEKVNDIDLFTSSKDTAQKFAEKLKGEQKVPYMYVSDNAFSVRLDCGLTAQFIHRWTFEKPEDVVPSFDFTIARAAIWYDGSVWKSLCDPNFYPDLASKRLCYCKPDRNEDAGGSILRVLKFYQRGYRIPLESLSAVIARLMKGVDFTKVSPTHEVDLAKVLTGLLHEVDPNIDMTNTVRAKHGA